MIVFSGYIFVYDDKHPMHRVDPDGVDWEKYMLNPILTLNHDWNKPPVGKCMQLQKDETGIKATVMADDWLDDRVDDFRLDPGFRTIVFEEREGYTYHKKVELIEISLVPRPQMETGDAMASSPVREPGD